ncbi:EamA family transporter [Halalkalibacillus sediminis]|uniref:EamA family transporter n=1 Tax=Halalkalibacillus sediminis TaxID=2018042 RepID=A0A2I0QRW4_9BACI|nr:EamA family transporter [Halalkalibacillus sediminis]PKR77068.1 EamA family transporter [Halalkalibacillus sediminis]
MNRYIIFVLLGAILWGTTGTAQALAPEEATPLVVGALRLLVGGIALLVYIFISRENYQWNLPLLPLFFSALAMAAYQPFFFTGVAVTGVAVGTVVALCSAPIFAGLFEVFLYRKVPDWVWGLSTLLAVIGCMLLFQSNQSIVVEPLGITFSLLAGFSFAVYTFVSKSLVTNHSSDLVVAVVFSSAAVMLLPILFFHNFQWIGTLSGSLSVLHLGIIATGVAYILFARGLKKIQSSSAVTLALAEPLTAAVLGIFLLGEELTFLSSIGLALLFVGLLLLGNKHRLLKNYS